MWRYPVLALPQSIVTICSPLDASCGVSLVSPQCMLITHEPTDVLSLRVLSSHVPPPRFKNDDGKLGIETVFTGNVQIQDKAC